MSNGFISPFASAYLTSCYGSKTRTRASGCAWSRGEAYADDEARTGRLPKGAYPILREALLAGELSREEAGRLTGYQERKGREVVAALLGTGLLVATNGRHKSPVRLDLPIDVVKRRFPRSYPAGLS